MKNFFRHWQYGIKARVIDGALVTHLDTAREPVFVRLELARLQTVALDVAAKVGEYELNLVNIGAALTTNGGATTTLAKFEVKDAAEEAAACIRCAILRGSQTHRFRRAFKTTLGALAAILLAILLAAIIDKLDGGRMSGGTDEQAKLQSLMQGMGASGMTGSAGAVKTPAVAGQPMSAEDFLNSSGGTPAAAPPQ